MTTIAYKDGIIAYDSRSTAGSMIIDDDRDKKTVDGERVLFCAGAAADINKFLTAYSTGEKPESCDIHALVVDKGVLFVASYDDKEDGFWKEEINPKKHCAIGSGTRYAITAMDMGASAKEAVKWAMKRDTGTGGRIRTYSVK